MKNIKAIIRLALSAVVCCALPAMAQESTATPRTESDTVVTAVVGAQAVDVDNDRGKARFEEFRDVPEGVVFDFARVAWTSENHLDTSFTAVDAGQDDQKYFLELWRPGSLTFRVNYSESLRTYSTGSKTLYSGIGTGDLTIPQSFRQGAEDAAGAPNAPFASAALKSYMDAALGNATVFDLRTHRKDLNGSFDFELGRGLSLSVIGRNETRDGTRPLGFGTYIRRQALSGVPGTGAGSFWRETVEARGVELIEPLDYKTTEFGATLTWARSGHSASAGVFASRFRNDITALYFDNPFEGSPGRASATIFDPAADQEPASPNGNNNLRGLTARSSMQLAPNNDYERVFGTVSLQLPASTRLNATIATGTMTQDDEFMPYAENPFVVFSGVAGQPGVVYARDAALPQPSLDGKMTTTQADVRITSRITPALNVRAGYRFYELDDQRPSILSPGFSSSGDSYFRASIGQKDATGKRVLFNEVGGYTRGRLNAGAAVRLGKVTIDGEFLRTEWEYDARQVEKTTENTYKATLRAPIGEGSIGGFYAISDRDFSGAYHVGLETSGVRAYDVWARERDQAGLDVELPFGENLTAGFGATFLNDEYPGAVQGFAHGYGLQDTSSDSFFAMVHYTRGDKTFGATAGVDRYEISSLQVTKSSLGADYNPINRWSRASDDRVVWISLDANVPFSDKIRWQSTLDFQRFTGTWETESLGTPDINSAIAYDYPELSDRTLSLRSSLLWDLTEHFAVELRYMFEPYRLNDFAIDGMQPYMQGSFKETRSSATDIGDMNVSRFLFLDSRYTDYDAHVASALLHLTF
jgi:hypothetical protein